MSIEGIISTLKDQCASEATVIADLLESILESSGYDGEEVTQEHIVGAMEEVKEWADYVIGSVSPDSQGTEQA